MSYTLLQLRQELARSTGGLIQGTATGGSTTTLVDTNLLDSGEFADDHLNGSDIYITDTTDDLAPKGEVRYVTDFVQSTGVATVGKAFTAAPGAGDTYDVYLRYTKDDLDTALMLAVKDWRLQTSLTLSSNTAEYALSATALHRAEQVQSVWLRESTDTQEAYEQVTNWRVWDNAGTLTLEFADVNFDGNTLCRVVYEARYDQMDTAGVYSDTATVGGDLATHLLHAQAQLYFIKMQSAAAPDRDWLASMYRERMERIDASGKSERPDAGKAKTQNWLPDTEHRYQPDWHL